MYIGLSTFMHAQLVSFFCFCFLVLLFFDCLYKNVRCLFIQNCMHIIQSIYLILYMCLSRLSPPPSTLRTRYNLPSFLFPPLYLPSGFYFFVNPENNEIK